MDGTAQLPPRQVGTIVVRRVRRTDDVALERFYGRLSLQARRTRFLATSRGLTPTQSVSFCTPDHHHREGFVAEAADASGTRIVGHLCLEPNGPREVEVAIVVADDYQRRGIGTRLVLAGAAWARREGFTSLTATMLAANGPIHRLLTGLGLGYRIRSVDAELSRIEIDLAQRRLAA